MGTSRNSTTKNGLLWPKSPHQPLVSDLFSVESYLNCRAYSSANVQTRPRGELAPSRSAPCHLAKYTAWPQRRKPCTGFTGIEFDLASRRFGVQWPSGNEGPANSSGGSWRPKPNPIVAANPNEDLVGS